MDITRKQRKIVSALFHFTIYMIVVYWHETSNPSAAFAVMLLFNLINYAASIFNYEYYLKMSDLHEAGKGLCEKILNNLDEAVQAARKSQKTNEGLRTYITELQNQFDEILDMNNRLNEVNKTIRLKVDDLENGTRRN